MKKRIFLIITLLIIIGALVSCKKTHGGNGSVDEDIFDDVIEIKFVIVHTCYGEGEKEVIIKDNDEIERIIGTIELVPKSACKCKHPRKAFFLKQDEEIKVTICDHCFDVEKDGKWITHKALKEFNQEHIYKNERVKEQTSKDELMFELLFEKYLRDLEMENQESDIFREFLEGMSQEYRERTPAAGVVRDFIAGMTDEYFLNQCNNNLIPQVKSRFFS